MTTRNSRQPHTPARAAAESMLARRSYSTQGLFEKLLEKGYEEPEAAAAVERLTELGYLDDEAYARSMADSLARRGYGARRIKQTLRHKGVDSELADETLSEEDSDDVDSRIDRWLTKLCKQHPPDRKEQSRLSAALFRRGFEGEDIRRGLRRYTLLQNGDYDSFDSI